MSPQGIHSHQGFACAKYGPKIKSIRRCEGECGLRRGPNYDQIENLYPSYGHAKSVAETASSRSPLRTAHRGLSTATPLAGDSVSALLSHAARAAALARLREPFVHAIDVAGHHGNRQMSVTDLLAL